MKSNWFGKNYLFMPSTLHVILTQYNLNWMPKPAIFSSQILEFLLGWCIWSHRLLMLTPIFPVNAAVGIMSVSSSSQSSAQYINRRLQLHRNAFICFNCFIVFTFNMYFHSFLFFLPPQQLMVPGFHETSISTPGKWKGKITLKFGNIIKEFFLFFHAFYINEV